MSPTPPAFTSPRISRTALGVRSAASSGAPEDALALAAAAADGLEPHADALGFAVITSRRIAAGEAAASRR
ncbi:MAG: hypothetical protein U0325_17180 [Polyangiales bacterium]